MIKRLLSICGACILSGCGSSGNVAGATGVGNPTGTTTTTAISVSAINGVHETATDVFGNDTVMTEAAAVTKTSAMDGVKSANAVRSSSTLSLKDNTGTTYSVDYMLMNVDSISLEIESDPVGVLDPRIHRSGDELVLTGGPWKFDLITGVISDSRRLEVILPKVECSAVRFYINDQGDLPAITLGGEAKNSAYRMELPCTMELRFDADSSVTIGGDLTKELQLMFNPDLWVAEISPFDMTELQNDTLVISPETVKPNNDFAHIRNQIRKSGVLRIK